MSQAEAELAVGCSEIVDVLLIVSSGRGVTMNRKVGLLGLLSFGEVLSAELQVCDGRETMVGELGRM